MVTLEQANMMKDYARNKMKADTWIDVSDKQIEVFKHLMLEWYGWPQFSLNFNRDMNKVMKVML